jgi:hypothetical protein
LLPFQLFPDLTRRPACEFLPVNGLWALGLLTNKLTGQHLGSSWILFRVGLSKLISKPDIAKINRKVILGLAEGLTP